MGQSKDKSKNEAQERDGHSPPGGVDAERQHLASGQAGPSTPNRDRQPNQKPINTDKGASTSTGPQTRPSRSPSPSDDEEDSVEDLIRNLFSTAKQFHYFVLESLEPAFFTTKGQFLIKLMHELTKEIFRRTDDWRNHDEEFMKTFPYWFRKMIEEFEGKFRLDGIIQNFDRLCK